MENIKVKSNGKLVNREEHDVPLTGDEKFGI